MSSSHLQRIVSSTAVYSLAALAQRGVAFILLPIYTHYIDPSEYGPLELLNAVAAVAFGCLAVGLPSAVNKCYHRDCPTEEDRRSVFATSLLVASPPLLLGSLAVAALAPTLSHWLTGDRANAPLVYLVAANGLVASLIGLALANLRARERAVAFAILTLSQFLLAMVLNVLFVTQLELGVRGVLLGNLLAATLTLPPAMLAAARGIGLSWNRRLAKPLLSFGSLLVPVMVAGWVMDLSDRFVLSRYRSLDEVAVYGIGYKVGLVVELAIVWPFQLAWPAVAFSISKEPGHRSTYARVLTYLVTALAFLVLALSLLSRPLLPAIVGKGYEEAYRVVPLVALAYAFNGVQYCVAPGVHLAGKTQWLAVLAWLAAGINLVLNLLWLPRFGMMGAAASTTAAFGFLAVATWWAARSVYPVAYEYRRLLKVILVAASLYGLTSTLGSAEGIAAVACSVLAVLSFPPLLYLLGFLERGEREALARFYERYSPLVRIRRRTADGTPPSAGR